MTQLDQMTPFIDHTASMSDKAAVSKWRGGVGEESEEPELSNQRSFHSRIVACDFELDGLPNCRSVSGID